MSRKTPSLVVVSVHPRGLGSTTNHTEQMTKELADELVRVRTRLEAETPKVPNPIAPDPRKPTQGT